MIRWTWLTLIVAVAAIACTDNSLAPSDVIGNTWQLVSIQRHGSDPIPRAERPRCALQLVALGRVRVKLDCNAAGVSYPLTGSTLQCSPLACTRAFGGDTSLDSVYSQALDVTKTVSISDSTLTIAGGGVT